MPVGVARLEAPASAVTPARLNDAPHIVGAVPLRPSSDALSQTLAAPPTHAGPQTPFDPRTHLDPVPLSAQEAAFFGALPPGTPPQATAPEAAAPEPTVHIGSIEIIIEAGAEPRAAPAPAAAAPDLASRFYLRGL